MKRNNYPHVYTVIIYDCCGYSSGTRYEGHGMNNRTLAAAHFESARNECGAVKAELWDATTHRLLRSCSL